MAATFPTLDTPKVRWDLSALFSGMDDPKIAQTYREAHDRADRFAETYRSKILDPQLDAPTLASGIAALESLANEAQKPVQFANLLFAADAADPKIGAFLQTQMEKFSEVRVKLMFFELELQAADAALIDRLLADPALANYRHYVHVTRALSPHTLTEAEEVLLEEVANTGSRAWVRLFEEVTSNHVFKLRRPESTVIEELTQEEILNLLREPDRELRQAAADALTQGLEELQRVLCFIYNNLGQDKKVEDRLRRFEYPEQSRHLANELDKETVDLVVGLCKEHHHLVARYYRIKREILGLPELTHIDRYAPLFEAEEQIDYDEARSMILDAFGSFSAELRDRAEEFFRKSWIDAEPRAGKTGGAFCSYLTPDLHPVIMMSYLNKMNDVGTLAHELGHGVHASLSRDQTPLNYHGTLPLAELASIFGEQLVFQKLVGRASTKDKLALYAEQCEGSFASVFRQSSMFRFEQRCHAERREQGELAPERFQEIWHEELQSMFGDSVKLGEQHRLWWSYVGHFYFAPFYVYAYAFGELLALSLYRKAQHAGQEFADRYVELLRLGGSKTPQELMDSVGVDLKSREFWLGGFKAIEESVEQVEALWNQLKGQ